MTVQTLRTITTVSILAFSLGVSAGGWNEDIRITAGSASDEYNSLNGSITVTVVGVTPSGNLLVQGEKWIEINQGQELIRISGLVRPADIQTDNSIESFRVANARITYSGRGAVARANTQGWLGRLFDSAIFPL